MAKGKAVPERPVLFCNRSDTKKWQDGQHQGRIMTSGSPRKSEFPQGQASGLSASAASMLRMSQNVEQLSNSITASKLTNSKVIEDVDSE